MDTGSSSWTKLRRRLWDIFLHSLRNLLIPAVNIGVSWLVISLASEDLWGEVVEWMIPVHLAVHLANWGNKEYLLRAFSRDPAEISGLWWQGLYERIPLLLAGGLVCTFLLPKGETLSWMWIWLPAAFWAQSFEVIFLYRKWFVRGILTELAGLLLLAAGLFLLPGDLSLEKVVIALALQFLGKAVGATLLGVKEVGVPHVPKWTASLLRGAFPFFLLGFSGLLQSRTDLYCVALYEDEATLGRYQVLINFLLYLQAVSGFVLMPFVRNIYRGSNAMLKRISGHLWVLGLVLALTGVPAVLLIYHYGYGFAWSWELAALGVFFVFPAFAYLPGIYGLYRTNRQELVVGMNVAGILLNLGGNLALLPLMGWEGALLAGALAQWMILIWVKMIKDESPGQADI